MARATQVHRDGRVTGAVEVQDGRGRPLVIEYETTPHAEPMSTDTMDAWERLLWGDRPSLLIDEAKRRAAQRRATTASTPAA
jgi:hypothetical protein